MDHEVSDDAVELRPFVAKALGSLGQFQEILRSSGHNFPKKTNHNASFVGTANWNVEEGFVRDFGIFLFGKSCCLKFRKDELFKSNFETHQKGKN